MSVSHSVCCSYREWGSPLIGNTHELRLELVAAVFVPLHTCVRVCPCVCVCAFFKCLRTQKQQPKKIKESQETSFLVFAISAAVVVVVVCLPLPGRFSFNNQFFFVWAWLVLFSVIFFCVALLLFSGICYLRSFSLSVWQRLMRLRARTFLSILLLLLLLLPFDFAARRI